MSNQLTLFVPPGTHTVGYRPEPDPVWLALRRVGLTGFAAWTVAVAGAWLAVAVGAAKASRWGRVTPARTPATAG